MRDRSSTNWFGENLDEQQKRRQWLENVYDNANNQSIIKSTNWNNSTEGEKVYNNVVRQEGIIPSYNQNIIQYGDSFIKGISSIYDNYNNLKKENLTDKYKHAFINCKAAQYGQGGTDVASVLSGLKEKRDLYLNINTLDESVADDYANKIGRLLGNKYPQGDCDELVQKYIKKYY